MQIHLTYFGLYINFIVCNSRFTGRRNRYKKIKKCIKRRKIKEKAKKERERKETEGERRGKTDKDRLEKWYNRKIGLEVSREKYITEKYDTLS